MLIVSAHFNDFDIFHEAAVNWELDFRLLSKNGFNAHLSMYATETIQVARTSLNGKIEQHGLVPPGFSSIVIPANLKMEYNWLHRDVNGSQILIFPSKGVLDSISFDGFDVFVISIENNTLQNWLEHFRFKNAIGLFGGNERFLSASPFFLKSFGNEVDSFLKNTSLESPMDPSSKLAEKLELDSILESLFKFLENANRLFLPTPARKRDLALKRSLDLIHNTSEDITDIKGLCKELNVSQRTLEYAFLEKYKVTPKHYIKAQKLHKVKQDILSDAFRSDPIFQIAGKYGFWHMGQFAADFKNHFGLLPSEIRRNHFQ